MSAGQLFHSEIPELAKNALSKFGPPNAQVVEAY